MLVYFFMFTARKYESGEYLNITGITRDQAGDYECGAENDIASPDTKTVRVTVNCEYHILLLFKFVYCQTVWNHMHNDIESFSPLLLEIQTLFQKLVRLSTVYCILTEIRHCK